MPLHILQKWQSQSDFLNRITNTLPSDSLRIFRKNFSRILGTYIARLRNQANALTKVIYSAGTLIRRGNKVHVNTKLSQFEDVEAFKKVLVRDREALDAAATVDKYVQHLGQREFRAYFDEPMEALAIVLPSQVGSSMAQLATFTITKAGWLTNVADNVFAALQRDNPKLVWTVKSDDENLTCE